MRGVICWISVMVFCCGFAAGGVRAKTSDVERKSLDGGNVEGRVIAVLAGNLIKMKRDDQEIVVKLRGVSSTVEINPTREQVYQQASDLFLERLILDKKIKLDVWPQTKQGMIPEVYIYRSRDRLFVNYQIIRLGFGHATVVRKHDYGRLFRTAESEARQEGLGLWGMKPPKTPYINQSISHAKRRFVSTDVVYVTLRDKKYHRDYCAQLRDERIPMNYQRARKAGYESCELCVPPRDVNAQ